MTAARYELVVLPLEEDRLKQISRSIRTYLPSADEPDLDQQIIDFKTLLDDVFETSSTANLSVTHRVAAWNTLCSLIDQSLESTVPQVREIAWTDNVWNRALELYLHHAQNARPKSSRQLLATLTNALRKSQERDLRAVKRSAASRLVSNLLDYEDPASAKVSAQLVSQLLQKDVLDVDDVFGAFPHAVNDTASASEELLAALLKWLGYGDFGSTIAHLVSVFLDKTSLSNETTPEYPVWTRPLRNAILRGTVNADDLRAHVLPVLFKRNFEHFVAFLQSLGLTSSGQMGALTSDSSGNDELLYISLQTGKELGMLEEVDGTASPQFENTLYIPVQDVGKFLFRSSRSARIAGLYLLVASHSATKPFSRCALRLMKRGLDVALADVDADFRGDVFSAFQKLTDRLRGITAVLSRQVSAMVETHGSRQKHERVLSHHHAFLRWLLKFLCWQLRPTASYQRHISALKCLSILAKSGLDDSIPRERLSKSALGATKWPFQMQVVPSEMQQVLLNLTMDPFDDVRQTASDILALVPSSPTAIPRRPLDTTLDRAEVMMLGTGRADHADGVAQLYALKSRMPSDSVAEPSSRPIAANLLNKLEQMLHAAQRSLSEAVARYPVHGLLTSLRYVMGRADGFDESFHCRLYNDLEAIWKVVKPVLCNDAPEGYAPNEVEEGLDSTKETLSYCWRALKEASLLMSTLVASRHLSQDDLKRISDLCFTQLAELRHRGAFSTVAHTWTTCCILCQDLKSSMRVSMLVLWYTKVLKMLRTNVTINTRRSAGIPSLLCGILIADKSSKLLASAFADLEAIARQHVDPTAAEEGSLPQVHAMNCLKDILKNTRLGERSEKYVPVALQLAADALRSDVWAIRNCGLMLFRAVIDRLLGTDQSHFDDGYATHKHISIHQHPQLIDVILGLLPNPSEAQTSASTSFEGVFPALQLLQHTQVPTDRLAQVKVAVRKLTASPSWHVRDKAARSLAALLSQTPPQEAVEDLQGFVAKSSPTQNALHGALLTEMYYIYRQGKSLEHKRVGDLPSESPLFSALAGLQEHIIADIWWFCRDGHSFLTRAAALDVVRAFEKLLLCYEDEQKLPDLADIGWHLNSADLEEPSHAAVRQATSRLLAQRICSDNSSNAESIDSTVYRIGAEIRIDQNSCEHFLKALQAETDRIPVQARPYVFSICSEILLSDANVGLKCEAQDLLLTLPSKYWQKPSPTREHLSVPTIDRRWYLREPGCNQRYADQWLQIRAVQLDICAPNPTENDADITSNISSLVDDCVGAVEGDGVHTREAAALAIDHLNDLWRSMTAETDLSDQFARLCIAIYDLLNDDDEDTRIRAAGVTQRILAGSAEGVQDMEPMTADTRLLAFCIARWSTRTVLADTAIRRAFDKSQTLAAPRPVATQLEALSRSDTALFVEEKQNLYIDEAKEVRVWSHVLSKMSPKAMNRRSINSLGSWVLEGLDAFIHHSQEHPDGPLGWSSKPDIFKLALQVIYGAELLLVLVEKGIRLPVRPSELRRRLFECAVAFEKGDVSCLLLWELDRVLSTAAMHKLALVREMIEMVR